MEIIVMALREKLGSILRQWELEGDVFVYFVASRAPFYDRWPVRNAERDGACGYGSDA